jgi:hypothetical protein
MYFMNKPVVEFIKGSVCTVVTLEDITGNTVMFGGTRWRSQLRPCATSRKVASLIPDCVSGIFHLSQSFRSHYGPGVDSAFNRNYHQE